MDPGLIELFVDGTENALPDSGRLDGLGLGSGSVVFIASDGHELRASRARLEADANTLTAEGPVKASGPMGRIEAGSLRVERRGEDGDFIWFENRVKVFIDKPNQKAD